MESRVSHLEIGNMEDLAQLDGLVAEGEDDGSTSGTRDPLAVGDSDVAVLQRGAGEEGLVHRHHVPSTSAVDASKGAVDTA
jgi:hypothetical protein